MISASSLDQLNAEQLPTLAAQLIRRNEQLTHEIALLKRFRFAKCSEQLNSAQASLLDDLIHTGIAATL
jgi:hypothetical protein